MEWLKSLGLTTIGSVGILSIIAFLSRNWFIARITKSIQHEYDKYLESHKEKLRKDTESELTKLRAGMEVEVEKAKLRFNFFSKEQFGLYNDLWLKLCDVKKAMFNLKCHQTQDALSVFREKVIIIQNVLEERSILIEQDHYEQLYQILQGLFGYMENNQNLINSYDQTAKGNDCRREITIILDNIKGKEAEFENKIDRMRNYLRNQISGDENRDSHPLKTGDSSQKPATGLNKA